MAVKCTGVSNMGWISIDIQCSECGNKWDDIVDRANVDNLFICKECGKVAGKKTISTPMVMKAAYPDGKKRFSDMKEAAKLKRIKGEQRSTEDRKRISDEIKKLKVKEYR